MLIQTLRFLKHVNNLRFFQDSVTIVELALNTYFFQDRYTLKISTVRFNTCFRYLMSS